MHRQILNAQSEDEVDHRSGCALDNRRANIRFCTHSQNMQNQRNKKGKSSRFKGVYWNKRAKKWISRIGRDGKIYLGLFDDEIEAAKAYDTKAKELFGEFARLNF